MTVDPDRLVTALTAAGWVEEGRRTGVYVRLRFPGERSSLVVPLDPVYGDFEDVMGEVIAELQHARTLGNAATHVLAAAMCSCGGKRWVDDENWQPDAHDRDRVPGSGLIPCGFCNEGGWATHLSEVSDPSGRVPTQ